MKNLLHKLYNRTQSLINLVKIKKHSLTLFSLDDVKNYCYLLSLNKDEKNEVIEFWLLNS
jgi:hypothetical protein